MKIKTKNPPNFSDYTSMRFPNLYPLWDNTKNLFLKSNYKSLCSKVALYFPAKEFWVPELSSKVNLLVLEVIWEKVLMIDHLIRKAWTKVNRCFHCKQAGRYETNVSSYKLQGGTKYMVFSSFLSQDSLDLPKKVRDI